MKMCYRNQKESMILPFFCFIFLMYLFFCEDVITPAMTVIVFKNLEIDLTMALLFCVVWLCVFLMWLFLFLRRCQPASHSTLPPNFLFWQSWCPRQFLQVFSSESVSISSEDGPFCVLLPFDRSSVFKRTKHGETAVAGIQELKLLLIFN